MALEWPTISKSRYLEGLRCRRLLWARYHAKQRFPPIDAATQALFGQGHEVGRWAQRLFPDGIEVAEGIVRMEAVAQQTQQHLPSRRPLFEAAFIHDGGYARVDLLVPVEDKAWDIYEVKSSTRVKEEHLHDLAFQHYVVCGAGLSVRRCYLVHVNKEYVRSGDVDPHALLHAEDVTDPLDELLAEIPAILRQLREVARGAEPTSIPIGPHCKAPRDCPLRDHCWAFLPPHNVTTLTRIGARSFELIEGGTLDIADLPEDFCPSARQQIQLGAVRRGKLHVDGTAVRTFLGRLQYPLGFFDVETFMLAVPPFDGTRPYQTIPFQFSVHLQQRPGAQLRHVSFLPERAEDPRQAFLAALQRALGQDGSVVVYNAAFEGRVLAGLAEDFPRYADFCTAITARFVDLLDPFRAFDVYHPEQKGSASLKAVLPLLTEHSYADLELNRGDLAGPEFLRVTFRDPNAQDRDVVRRNLETYCGLDTEGMVSIVDNLRSLASS